MTTLLDDLETNGTIAALDAIDEIKRMEAKIERLKVAIKDASETLKCPAAEYVPAMSVAWGILDRALLSR